MKILVTGGAGYIGSHTTSQLILEGHETVVFDNLSTGFREAVPAGADFIHGDVRDSQTLEKILRENKIDAVIHFAAKLIVPESIVAPIEYYENNTSGVLSLVKACRGAGVNKIVFSSTAAVYGNASSDGLISESASVSPINPYGASKLMSEQILRDCENAYDIRSVILRYFNVAGASSKGCNGQRTLNATHLIKVAAEAAVGKRKKVDIFGTNYPTPDGTCVRDYIHVEDLADLHLLSLSYLISGGKTDVFNCGYGRGFSVRDVLTAVKRVSGIDFIVEEKTRREGDPASLVASSKRAVDVFKWQPKFGSLDLICKSAVDWEKGLN